VIVDRAAAVLAEHGVPTPRVDAEWIVAHAVGVGRSELVAGSREVDEAVVWPLVERRAAREPLAYVLGEWGFRRLTLTTDSRALVPRPETEIVVERCLVHLAGVESPEVLDVGVGSGAIALAIADEHPGARVTGIDVSADALALAAENAERTGLAERVTLAEHDVIAGLPGGPYDLVVSNPPYVLPEEIEALDPEVREWEPRQALVGRGLTETIARAAPEALRTGGWLVLEVAEDGAAAAADMLTALGFRSVSRSRDLAERERVVEGQWES